MSGGLFRGCLDCRTLVRGKSRCVDCQRKVDRAKVAKRPRFKTYSETERRRRAVAEHRATIGDWCPGWEGQAAHPSADLTADHPVEVAAGGLESGPLVVRCRSCNAARSARVLSRMLGRDPSPGERAITHRDGDDPGPVAA
jgi:5-methylcytosine-specific restriction protein A